jgi:hypothetical protein
VIWLEILGTKNSEPSVNAGTEMKLLDTQSSEYDVAEFLRLHFGQLDDASAQRFAKQDKYLRKPRRGKPRNPVDVELFQGVASRAENLTIDEAIDTTLQLKHLPTEKNESAKRGYHRHKKRTHSLLDPFRIYNEKDFAEAVFAKDFNIAEAIFSVCSDISRRKIVTLLNEIA